MKIFKKSIRKWINILGYDIKAKSTFRKFDLPEAKIFNKVFCIGYNKTGTTTLAEILSTYGFNLPNQQTQERYLSDYVFNTDYSGFEEFIGHYDAYQDTPFSQGLVYVACDVLFPDSKFILSVRDEDEWFRSVYRFHQKIFDVDDLAVLTEEYFRGKELYLGRDYTYNSKKRMLTTIEDYSPLVRWDLLYDEEHYKSVYRSRNEQIIRYFANRPDKLLVIDITKERDTSKICNFLNFPTSHIMDMPHKNKT